MKIFKCYDYDDLLLIPTPSKVNSREDVDISIELSKFLKLKIPIIASPMIGIVNPQLIVKLSHLGGIGILHRWYEDISDWKFDIYEISKTCTNWGFSIGLSGDLDYEYPLDMGAKVICIDVANGYLESVKKRVLEIYNFIYDNNYDCLIMSGNVVTDIGALDLAGNGTDLIRVGIGSGGLCTTRNVTGVGLPQLTAINECAKIKSRTYFKYKEEDKVVVTDEKIAPRYIVADGGIKNSGDAVKAFAVGADLVMLGSLLGNVYESSHNGTIYGMASRRHQEEYYHTTKSVEGIERAITKTVPLEDFIKDFTYGIKSAFTYLNVSSIEELHNNEPFFAEVGNGTLKKL